jgi:hypothetical protein
LGCIPMSSSLFFFSSFLILCELWTFYLCFLIRSSFHHSFSLSLILFFFGGGLCGEMCENFRGC